MYKHRYPADKNYTSYYSWNSGFKIHFRKQIRTESTIFPISGFQLV